MLVLRLCYLLALFTPALVLAVFADTPQSIIRQTWLDLVLSSLEHAGGQFGCLQGSSRCALCILDLQRLWLAVCTISFIC